MTDIIHRRLILVVTGAIAGLALYFLVDWQDQIENARLLTLCFVAVGVFFGSFLILFGRISLLKSLRSSAVQMLMATALYGLATLRFAPDQIGQVVQAPQVLFGLLILCTIPLPFHIVVQTSDWKDYRHLFQEAWSIFVRYTVAWILAGLSFLLIQLSEALLSTVGVTLIGDLLDHSYIVLPLVGGLLGLGLALVQELDAYISPILVIRLVRIFAPFILFVGLVFLVSITVNGAENFRQFLSPAGILLVLVAVSVSVISAAIDRDETHAAHGRVIAQSARAMCLLVPVMAGIAAWGLWVRVSNLGWTPDRVLAAMVAAVALAYGGTYAGSVLRGASWMQYIRQGNIRLALVIICVAGLGMTPLIDAEKISAQSQLARFGQKGFGATEDLGVLSDWGVAGAAALAELSNLAKEPGHEALAAAVARAQGDDIKPQVREALIAELTKILPVQPASATATRDIFLAGLDDGLVSSVLQACQRGLKSGHPACVLVVADFLPSSVGEEAILYFSRFDWDLSSKVLIEGAVQDRPVIHDRKPGTDQEIEALIDALQAEPLPLRPVAVNEMVVNGKSLIIVP